MNVAHKEKIIEALQSKGVNKPCPRCSSYNFEVVGQTILPLNDNPRELILGGDVIPFAIVACSNCGYTTLHALSSLNLLSEDTGK